jgi:ketosteroid isomerase-like protein
MGLVEAEAARAIHQFYAALDQLLRGYGMQAMNEIWGHGTEVTTSHPFGDWARGWAEVSASWEESLAVFALYKGHVGRSDSVGKVEGLQVLVVGDMALATSVYKGTMYMSEGRLELNVNCTNVARRIDGRWKIIHHHADQAPAAWNAAIGTMVQRGHS